MKEIWENREEMNHWVNCIRINNCARINLKTHTKLQSRLK